MYTTKLNPSALMGPITEIEQKFSNKYNIINGFQTSFIHCLEFSLYFKDKK